MDQVTFSTDEERLLYALGCMNRALELLDEADAPADIGAHLDLAICRLKEALPDSSVATQKATPAAGRLPK